MIVELIENGSYRDDIGRFINSPTYEKVSTTIECMKECDKVFKVLKSTFERNLVKDGTRYGKFENSDIFEARFSDGRVYLHIGETGTRCFSCPNGISYAIEGNECSLKYPDGNTFVLYDDEAFQFDNSFKKSYLIRK